MDNARTNLLHQRARVLVIDDDPLFRNLVLTLLRKDYFVSVAADGDEGFFQALQEPPEVAIIDVQMPGWDGLRTLKAFRDHPALRGVKVIMLTSDPSRETVLAAIRAGADEYVIKTSFSRDEFMQKLERLLPFANDLDAADDAPQPVLSRDLRTMAIVPPGAPGRATAVSTAGIDEDAALQSLLDSWE